MKKNIRKNQLRVMHIITGLPMGGAQMALFKLLSKMDRERFEPVVISLMDRGVIGKQIIDALGIQVYEIGMVRGKPTPADFWRLARVIRSLQPVHLIQGWEYHGNLAATVAGLLTSKPAPVLWNVRHTPYNLKDEKRMTSILIRLSSYLSSKPTRIIYAASTSAVCHEALGYVTQRRVVIPNGFDMAKFVPSVEARSAVCAELGISPDSILIGIVARYHPMKDHANFLNAAAILTKKYSNVHFLMIGHLVDASNKLMNRLIEDNGIKRCVHLLGERQDIPKLTAALNIAVLSSAWGEAFPNVIGEAMACGVPCIVTDVGDSAWIVGNSGYVVPPRNPRALADAWNAILTLSPDERRNLSLLARQRVEKHFSLTTMVRAYEGLYEELLNN